MQLRYAGAGDAAGIAEVQVRTWQAAYRGQVPDPYLDSLSIEQQTARWEVIIAESRPPNSACLVVEIEGQVVAFAHITPSRDSDATEGTGELTSIYLLAPWWGQGVGRALMERATEELTAGGYRDATLWVLGTNVRALRFYEAAGWAPDGATQVTDTRGAPLVELRYRRRLPIGGTRPPSVSSRG